jgi:hypothetical protein
MGQAPVVGAARIVHVNVAKDGRRERGKADSNQKEAHISDACIVMACEGLRRLFWSKIVGAGCCRRRAGASCARPRRTSTVAMSTGRLCGCGFAAEQGVRGQLANTRIRDISVLKAVTN